MPNLTVKQVESTRRAGMIADGSGLYLNVKPSGAKSWILRVTVKGEGRRREIGLGSTATLTLAQAREKAASLRALAKQGLNPIAARDERSLTFEEAAREAFKIASKAFRSDKHAQVWINSLSNHVFPTLGKRPVASITAPDLSRLLLPIFEKSPVMATRVKGRIAYTLDWAITGGFHRGPHPIDRSFDAAFKTKRRATKHHKALPWKEVPAFIQALRDREAIAARALEFGILTATRSAEFRGARWEEFDLQAGVWTVPAARTKMEKDHRVPLSECALRLVEVVQDLDANLLFPSPAPRSGKPTVLSINAFRPLFKRMGHEGLTAHGFRSSFRDWAGDTHAAEREVAEMALAHRPRGVEGAYARSDLLERRRPLMERWGQFCSGETGEVMDLASDR